MKANKSAREKINEVNIQYGTRARKTTDRKSQKGYDENVCKKKSATLGHLHYDDESDDDYSYYNYELL